MAANLTPQYHDAEAKYRAAGTLEEKLAALEEMWRELPKHKSTEKLQGELKRKLSTTRKEIQAGGKKTSVKTDPFAIPKCGGGQVVLLGAPNVGKSSIVGAPDQRSRDRRRLSLLHALCPCPAWCITRTSRFSSSIRRRSRPITCRPGLQVCGGRRMHW